MNCEVCAIKFKGIQSLSQHENTEQHQENIKRCQNTLSVLSVEAPSGSIPIPINSVSGVCKNLPADDDGVPSALSDAFSAAVPVPAEAVPVVYKSKIENSNVFFCMPCSMAFCKLSDIIHHSESLLHAIMALATGIGFDEQEGVCEEYTDSVPELYSCIACNFRCLNSKEYDVHLRSKAHSRIAQFMKEFYKGQEEKEAYVCFNNSAATNELSKFPPLYYCKSCYIPFRKSKCYRRHIYGKKQISGEKKENDGAHFIVLQNENLNIYHCKFCNILFHATYYDKHLKWKTHKRIELYINTMSCRIYTNTNIFYNLENLKKLNNDSCHLYYCELCNTWHSGSKSYENHLNGKKHIEDTERNQTDALSGAFLLSHNSQWYRCELCDIRCSTFKSYEIHLNGKKHSRKTAKLKKHIDAQSGNLLYFCELCKIRCADSKCYEIHLNGKKHGKKADRGRARTLPIVFPIRQGDAICKEDAEQELKIIDDKEKNIEFSTSMLQNFPNKEQVHLIGEAHMVQPLVPDVTLPLKTKETRIDSSQASRKITGQFLSLYYCESCKFQSATPNGYRRHLKSKNHGKIQRIYSKISNHGEGNVARISVEEQNYCGASPFYCELCDCRYNTSKTREEHLKGKLHTRITQIISKVSNFTT